MLVAPLPLRQSQRAAVSLRSTPPKAAGRLASGGSLSSGDLPFEQTSQSFIFRLVRVVLARAMEIRAIIRLAVAATVAVLALGSISAKAHPGHHHHAVEADATTPPAEFHRWKSTQNQAHPAEHELRESRAQQPDASPEAAVPVRGCCMAGAWSACISLLAPVVPTVAPSTASRIMTARDGPHRPGIDTGGLLRPPKTLV